MWVGIFFGYFALLGIYYTNTWNVSTIPALSAGEHVTESVHQAKTFPFMSTSIFDSQGNVYNQTFVFGDTFTLNKTALEELGPPYLSGGNVLNNMSQNWAVCREALFQL